MPDLLAARLQMAVSLGFHIVFAAISMTMPFFMAHAQSKWIRSKDSDYEKITRAWLKGVAIFFATGAVSGTALSFELGLLWPAFMEHAGGIIGMPFSWEGAAFFLEAVCIGIYLYGFGRLNPWVHWLSGVLVGLSGVASAFFVICANAWMNVPAGFDWVNGQALNIDPFAAMFNPAWFKMGLHMVLASFAATGFGCVGIHAYQLLKNPKSSLHRKALKIALLYATCSSLLLPLNGDFLAKQTARLQPVKFAAMEAHFETQSFAPLVIGSIADQNRAYGGIAIPGLLSFMAHGDPKASVVGLNDFPKEVQPPVGIVHFAFEIMIIIGMGLLFLSCVYLGALYFKKDLTLNAYFLKVLVAVAPLGFIGIQAGWIVTEVGRQPWIIQGVMKTAEAVSPMPGLIIPCLAFCGLYFGLAVMVTLLIWRLIKHVE